MSYWKYLGTPSYGRGGANIEFTNTYILPFVYGGVTFDETNKPLKCSGYYNRNNDSVNQLKVYPIDTSNSLYFIDSGISSVYHSYGYCALAVSDSSSIGANLSTTTIKGKYKLKTTILPQYNGGDKKLSNSCYPVSVSLNGVTYKYICFATLAWSNTYAYYGYALGFFSKPNEYNKEPIDFTIITESYTSGNVKKEYQEAVLDFGDTPQETTQVFVDYINSIADVVYSESYTVKSSDGSQTLSTLTEAPSMTKAVLSTVGSQKTLVLTGENDKEYTMTWTSETPEGYRFLGLSTKPNSSTPNVPTGGIETTVVWSGDTVLYEVYGVYRPPATTFSVYLYKCSCDSKVVDKTEKLTQVALLQGALRDVTSMLSFDIIVEYGQVPTFNYAYIPSFNRYYFIDDIVSVNNNMWEMLMSVDVLMTYKTAIKALPAFIDRSESNYDRFVIDNNLPMKQGEVIETTFVTNELFVKESGNGTYVLQGLDVGVGEAVTEEA